MSRQKVVVVLSGGLDSTTTLYWVKVKHQGYNTIALTFDYGSKHNKREIKFAKYHCKLLSISHQIIQLDFNKWGFESNLLKSGSKIPEGHYEDSTMKQTVVPFRNGILLSIAVGYAESIDAAKVFLGSHKGDRTIYPDCRKEFTQAISLASQLGTYNNVEIISPFNDWLKKDIVKEGLELKVDYSKTWSCYIGQKRPCLKCGTCVERTEAFFANDIKDPLLIEAEWFNAVKYMKEVQ